MKNEDFKHKIIHFIATNSVPILFVLIILIAIPLSGFSTTYLIREMITRLTRNSFLVLALIIPIIAGMGLNFGMVLGAMAGQISLILITDWNFTGLGGVSLAVLISIPLSLGLGYICGHILNMAKGKEMVTGLFLGFFFDGIYQLVVMFTMGKVIPISKATLILPRGYGIRNTVNLDGVRQVLDHFYKIKIGNVFIPVLTIIIIVLLCLFTIWFRKTKLGQDMRALGQDMAVSESSGINVARTRILAILISTILAGIGQIIFLQNIGTLNTYNSHTQTGMFAAAALLIGGATVSRATIPNVFIGVLLFHTMFVVSPMAGKELIGDAQIGEYFRQFVSYGVIAIALVLHAWRRHKDKEKARQKLRGA